MIKRIFLLFIAVISATMLMACAGETAPEETMPTDPTLEMVGTEPATEPPVQISAPKYELTYSGELKDEIKVEEVENGLKFIVILSKGEYPVFTMQMNSEEGELVIMLDDASGNKQPVAFRMEPIPEDLDEADEYLFCTAQESVNDIVDSLVLK